MFKIAGWSSGCSAPCSKLGSAPMLGRCPLGPTVHYCTELIVILTLTSLVITEKDSAPLNDELCV